MPWLDAQRRELLGELAGDMGPQLHQQERETAVAGFRRILTHATDTIKTLI